MRNESWAKSNFNNVIVSIPLGLWPRQRKCIAFCWRAWPDGASLWPFTIFKVKTLKKLLKHSFHLELVFCYTIPQSTSVSSAMTWRHLSISSRRSERDTTFWINDRRYVGISSPIHCFSSTVLCEWKWDEGAKVLLLLFLNLSGTLHSLWNCLCWYEGKAQADM